MGDVLDRDAEAHAPAEPGSVRRLMPSGVHPNITKPDQ
jgi:hypothetical protein